MKPEPDIVHAELEHLLSSPKIRTRKLIKKFLQYVVEETLAGRGAELNQYTIAVHGLGKPADFSPIYNPIVRIEAGRLRKLLDEHYCDNPYNRQLAILIPKGAYQAEFHPLDQVNIPAPMARPQAVSVTGNTEGPRLLLYLQILSQTDIPASFPLYRLHGELLLMLSRFRNIRLVSSSLLETGHLLTRQGLRNIHDEYQADYVLNGNITSGTDGIELSFMLAHTLNDEIIWQSIILLPPKPQPHDVERVCHEVAANTVSVHSGLMLRHWAQHLCNQSDAIPAHHAALASYLNFLRKITPESFAIALKACQQRLQHYPDDSKALIILSRLCGYDHVLHYRQIPDLEQTWIHAARMAMKLDPGNAEAHSVFAHNNYYRGELVLCRAELEIARQANPFDTACEFMYAMGLFFLGDKAGFVEKIDKLLAIRFNPPDWYHIPSFLHYFNEGDYRQAFAHAERIQYFGHWGELARCVSYAHLNQKPRALAELSQLLEKHPCLLQANALQQLPFAGHPAILPLRETMENLINSINSSR
jgi:tetratricopeptide (TPR) repeat protein